jgi:flagellar hook protein FlgE
MSLFGALASGVSGLTAQSSALGAISDNITNVNTIGYKNTTVNFQTLVTRQTSTTFYSAGGVQSKPRQDTGVQGLLQSSTSQTDVSISGRGFFVVNEANTPTITNEFLFTRSGSFFLDNEGFLRNTAGFYLQAWPTTAAGVVTPNNKSLTIPNQNVISTDYLASVNLNRVGGTAAATTRIDVGANLPSTDTAGKTHKTDVQFFDTLGNANTASFVYTRTDRDNQWDLTIAPPQGTAVATIEDSSGNAYASIGQLEFLSRPRDGATVIIQEGATAVTYEFDTNASVVQTATLRRVDISTSTSLAQDVAALVSTVKGFDTDFADYGGFTNNRIRVSAGSTSTVQFIEDGTKAITINPTGLLNTSGQPITRQESSFTVRKVVQRYSKFDQFTFTANPADTNTVTINGRTYEFDNNAAITAGNISVTIGGTLAATLANLEAAIEANDPRFPSGGTVVRLRQNQNSGANDTLVLNSISTGSYTVTFSAGFTGLPTEPDGTATYVAATAHTVNTNNALIFDSDGLPSVFNFAELEILQFTNGAADMDNAAANSPQIKLNFGNVGEANGFTQFGATFTPVFITQNGSQFGTFAGVTINTSGLVTALFDNGETRPVFKIPVATFTNVNGLEGRTGNVWNSTEQSGDPTLREANNGPAGQVIQAALEASTVDIGQEFTNMIVVQRAYSAAARIISTADQMLEELTRIKR